MFIDEIDRHFTLRGALTGEQHERLGYIATRRPVRQTLTMCIHDTLA